MAEKHAGAPLTGADLKQQPTTTGGPAKGPNGEPASDMEKKRLAEENKDGDVGSASEMAESGALMEQAIKDAIPLDHPAVDNEPRKGLPEVSNRIDFNDPNL